MNKSDRSMDRPYTTSLHMPSIWGNYCLSVSIKPEKISRHQCWRSNKSSDSDKSFEMSAATVWRLFLQILHYKVLLGIAEIFSQKYDEILSKAFRESTKGKMTDLRKVLGGLSSFASEELEAELMARDQKVQRLLKKAHKQAREGRERNFEDVLRELKNEDERKKNKKRRKK